jgi:hypothetical protein
MHYFLVLLKRTARFYLPLSLQIFTTQKLTTQSSQLAQIMCSLHTVHTHILEEIKIKHFMICLRNNCQYEFTDNR